MGELRHTNPGESVVYWMRNEDMRGSCKLPFTPRIAELSRIIRSRR
jgi:hypothetical protein